MRKQERPQHQGNDAKRVAIVGTGPAGLVTLKEMLERGLEVTAFDPASSVGGLMRRAPANMQLTTSNLISSFSSHFREFDLEKGPAFWSRDDYVEYLESFAEHFDLIDRIRFSTRVTNIQRSGDTGKWTVTWHRNNGAGQEILEEKDDYDHVVVCTGTNAVPVIPEFPGAESFAGEIVHSGEIQDLSTLTGKKVVLVGLGESGSDFALEIARIAESTILSTRKGPGYVIPRFYRGHSADLDTNRCYHALPRSISGHPVVRFKVAIENLLLKDGDDKEVYRLAEKINAERGLSPFHRFSTKSASFVRAMIGHDADYRPGIASLDNSRVHFNDGSEAECDVVLCCTGYRPSFDFLGEAGSDLATLALDPRMLYRRMIGPETGLGISFVGLVRPNLGTAFACMELQARYLALLLSGEIPLPPKEDMEEDIERHKLLDLKQFTVDANRLLALTDYYRFMEATAVRIDCKPSVAAEMLKNPLNGWSLLFAPLNSMQYRLNGPYADRVRAFEVLRRLPKMPWPVLTYELFLLMVSPLLVYLQTLFARSRRGNLARGQVSSAPADH